MKLALHPQAPELSQKLGAYLNQPPLIAQLLLNRQIRSLEEAKAFLFGTSETANFEALLLDQACALVETCIGQHKKIMVYGDYDVDGMTSTALVTSALKQMGAKVDYYIPYRFTEGYGLNIGILDKLISDQVSLLITLDCGISNVKEISRIKEAGIQVMVLDHHKIPEKLPPADVILNPQSLDPAHPLRPLCTVGIAYKWIDYYFAQFYPELNSKQYLDLVALGTIADVAALTGENRRLTQQGMKALSKRYRPGIDQLLALAKFDKPEVSVRDIGFTIAPRLNAAGRLSHAKWGVELLLHADRAQTTALAEKLQKLNEERQHIGQAIFKEAKEAAHPLPHRVIALAKEGWHPGIIGITASKLTEAFSKPAVMIAIENGIGRGSARSFGSVNIYDVLKECQDYFENFGGHKQAAGFSILPENIPAFQAKLAQLAASIVTEQDLVPVLQIDAVLSPEEMSLPFYELVEALGPFGQGNPIPLFYTNVLTPIDFKTVGDGSHLKARFTDKAGRVFDAIGFGLGGQLERLYQESVELVFHLDKNTWGGKTLVQLNLVHIV